MLVEPDSPSPGKRPSAECGWVLLRAFGPGDLRFRGSFQPAAALAVADRLDLAVRIAARTDPSALAEQVGGEVAAAFRQRRVAAAARELQLEESRGRIGQVARDVDCLPILLKHFALRALGIIHRGTRSVMDVDILLDDDHAQRMQSGLRRLGYREEPLPEPEHHLPRLAHPTFGRVEIHRMLPGVRLDGRRSATYASLESLSLLRALEGELLGFQAVVPPVLTAHCLVHGLVQHGSSPASYPLTRMLSDLLDLELDSLPASQLRALADWTSRDSGPAALPATIGLCARLRRGEGLEQIIGSAEDGAGGLLRHVLAGRLDPDYAQALRLGFFRRRPSDRTRAGSAIRQLATTLVPARSQLNALYGPSNSRIGHWARRVYRPFDLARRAVLAILSRWRIHRRGR